jgi:hypothetical protein
MHRFLAGLGLLTLATGLVAEEPSADVIAAPTREALSRGFVYTPPPPALPAPAAPDVSAPAILTLPDVVVSGRQERRARDLDEEIARQKQTESKALIKNDSAKSLRIEALLPPETEIAGPPNTRDNPAAKIGPRFILPLLRFSW